jgi:DNA-binding MarR family transcriptional regulator
MERDSVDAHVIHWTRVIPDLDPDIEGAVTRMQKLVHYLRLDRDRALAEHGLQGHEFDTLFVLAGRDRPFRAGPTELAKDLRMSPAAMTGRLDGLEARGWVRRLPSETDRRKVVVELTEEGLAVWQEAMDNMGHTEDVLLGVLSAGERRQLSDLLRRVLLAAEKPK